MSKDWEKEFKKKFKTKTKRYPKKDWPSSATDYYKQTIIPAANKKVISFIYEELAKQRTQLLKEVKEKVLVKLKKHKCAFKVCPNQTNYDDINLRIDEQLKKLKELEEGK